MKTRALLQNLSEADLRLLRIFVAIAESGGLSAAELRLNISRSVISRHLKDLELRLGIRLCERGRAGFALTEEGAQVLEATRRLLAQMESFRSEIVQLSPACVANCRWRYSTSSSPTRVAGWRRASPRSAARRRRWASRFMSRAPPRSLTTTFAPRAASANAFNRPRPPPAPVQLSM